MFPYKKATFCKHWTNALYMCVLSIYHQLDMRIIKLLSQKQNKIFISNNVSLTTKVIVMPGMWISRFSPSYTCQSPNPSSKRPPESQSRATWNTKVVISPGMWVCRFVDPCTFHATNAACKTPSHSWVPSVTT